jgi:GNAT superfamily N-acetyltransferase
MPDKPIAGETDREIAGRGDVPIRRVGKHKSSYTRADGTEVKPHVQRYWFGSKVDKKVPHYSVLDPRIKENERIRQARRQYYTTTSLGQRLWDNNEYATIDVKGKLQPGIFGRDDKGNPILIEEWQWELWQSRPNQYDIFRVDDPVPDKWEIRSNVEDFDGRKRNNLVFFKMYELDKGYQIGSINLVITKDRDEYWDSEEGKWKFRWKHIASPDINVQPEYEGQGVATYLIREALDFGDQHDISATISAQPKPVGIERGVLRRGTQVIHFDESEEGFENRVAHTKAAMKDMYMSFGLTGGPSTEEIYERPHTTFRMRRKPYSQIEPEIIRKRQVKRPDTAEYKEKITKAAKKRGQ